MPAREGMALALVFLEVFPWADRATPIVPQRKRSAHRYRSWPTNKSLKTYVHSRH